MGYSILGLAARAASTAAEGTGPEGRSVPGPYSAARSSLVVISDLFGTPFSAKAVLAT